MATIYRVHVLYLGKLYERRHDTLDDAKRDIQAAIACNCPYAVYEPCGTDWWNSPPHPRLQRVMDRLDEITIQEFTQ